ncbi:MAG TPA: hypothetical protein VMH86_09450 [Rhizomicrobium sp.]|nr:hypothetical protein [Rhizomicrobium sp.]
MTRDARQIMLERAAIEGGADVVVGGDQNGNSGLPGFVCRSAGFVVPAFYIATFLFALFCAKVAYSAFALDNSAETYAAVAFVVALALGYVFIRVHFGALGALILTAMKSENDDN